MRRCGTCGRYVRADYEPEEGKVVRICGARGLKMARESTLARIAVQLAADNLFLQKEPEWPVKLLFESKTFFVARLGQQLTYHQYQAETS